MLLDALERWAGERPLAPALVDGKRSVAYAELKALAEVHAGELARRGLGPGARLAILVTTATETLGAVLGAYQLGASTLLVSSSSPPRERARLVDRFGAETILSGRVVSSISSPRRPDASLLDPGPALALVTSGVTGYAKIAERSWETVTAGALALAQATALERQDVLLCTTPLHHTYSFVAGLLGCLAQGATYIAAPTPTPPATLAELCIRHGVTVLFSVPLLYRWYLESPPLERPPRLAVSAGEALSPELVDRWHETYGQPLCNHYGSTELGMVSFEPEGVPGSVGWPLRGVSIAVETLAGRTSGEIIVRTTGTPPLLLDVGPSGRRDSRAPTSFRTGDSGWLADDGRLHLQGRLSPTIDLGGEKVVPGQVEDVIRRYSPIRDCVVLAVPDERDIPRLCAYVEGDAFARHQLRAFLLEELSAHEVPSVIRIVRRLPRTATGKIRRCALLEPPTDGWR